MKNATSRYRSQPVRAPSVSSVVTFSNENGSGSRRSSRRLRITHAGFSLSQPRRTAPSRQRRADWSTRLIRRFDRLDPLTPAFCFNAATRRSRSLTGKHHELRPHIAHVSTPQRLTIAGPDRGPTSLPALTRLSARDLGFHQSR